MLDEDPLTLASKIVAVAHEMLTRLYRVFVLDCPKYPVLPVIHTGLMTLKKANYKA